MEQPSKKTNQHKEDSRIKQGPPMFSVKKNTEPSHHPAKNIVSKFLGKPIGNLECINANDFVYDTAINHDLGHEIWETPLFEGVDISHSTGLRAQDPLNNSSTKTKNTVDGISQVKMTNSSIVAIASSSKKINKLSTKSAKKRPSK